MTTSKKKKATKKLRAGRLKKDADGLTAIQRQFLDALLELGEVKAATEAIGINRNQHYKLWLHQDAYAEAYEKVQAVVAKVRADEVLSAIKSRGVDGWTEEIIEEKMIPIEVRGADGKKTTEMVRSEIKRKKVKKWSVPCLLWEGNRLYGNPARFEITGPGGGPVEAKISVEAFRMAAEADE